MADPTDAHRAIARTVRAMFTALVDEGFTEDQAVALLRQVSSHPQQVGLGVDLHEEIRKAVAVYAADARQSRVAELLGRGQQKSPARSTADDRAAELWNPPATNPGAPAHD